MPSCPRFYISPKISVWPIVDPHFLTKQKPSCYNKCLTGSDSMALNVWFSLCPRGSASHNPSSLPLALSISTRTS